MTEERYRELRAGGPEITAEDHERLRGFVPEPTAIAVSLAYVWGSSYCLGVRRVG